jgi:hypothetical protein
MGFTTFVSLRVPRLSVFSDLNAPPEKWPVRRRKEIP